MKLVSSKVAKALKDAGYPQDYADGAKAYTEDGSVCITRDEESLAYPTYMEVWLWLWRKKGFFVKVMPIRDVFNAQILERTDGEWHSWGMAVSPSEFTDPEDALIAAIDYIVDNNLIK